jgi:2-oxoglutarate dehydrogenase E2 component (dihydrolipoamide succinyltransferase)
MTVVEVRIPPLGESVSQGVIARWLKKDGDLVQADEALFELETDKASMEIPAEVSGRLEILKPEGSEVTVGTVVARIVEDGSAQRAAASPVAASPERSPGGPAGGLEAAPKALPRSANAAARLAPEEPPLSPAVRRLVAEHGLDPRAIPATGKGGRLTKADVVEFLERAAGGSARTTAPETAPGGPAPTPVRAPQSEPGVSPERPAREEGEDVERVKMTLLRRRIAERLVEAQRTAAILTTFNEIDMSAVQELRRRYRERFEKVHGVRLGLMSLFGRAVIQAIRDVPVVNAQIDGSDIVYFKRVHLGIAVATPRGLVVPVVRNADRLSLGELERAIAELAASARDGKLSPDQLAGGTFTISNGGVYGSLLSTPILNPPQSAILGMHKIEERPVVVGGEIVVRPMMYVALSYDHRLIDGEQAVTFLVRVKERLEDPARLLLEV